MITLRLILFLIPAALLGQTPQVIALTGHGVPAMTSCDVGRTFYTDVDAGDTYLCAGSSPAKWMRLLGTLGQGPGELDMTPGTPSTPPAPPFLRLFFDSNNVLNMMDPLGNVTPIGGGGSTPFTACCGILYQNGVVKANPAAIRTFLSGSASLTFGSIAASGGCVSKTIPVTGAVIGDKLYLGTPVELLTYSLALTYAVSASDTVTIRLCNYTSAAITPPILTWNVDVVKSF